MHANLLADVYQARGHKLFVTAFSKTCNIFIGLIVPNSRVRTGKKSDSGHKDLKQTFRLPTQKLNGRI